MLLELRWPVLMWLVASAIADIALTTSLVFYLVRDSMIAHADRLSERAIQARRKSGFAQSDHLVDKVSQLSFRHRYILSFTS